MKVLIAADPDPSAEATTAAIAAGLDAEALVLVAPSVEGSVARLAGLLTELEPAMVESAPELVVAADRTDLSFAAALTAAKLAIAVGATPEALREVDANGRAIRQLVTATDLDFSR